MRCKRIHIENFKKRGKQCVIQGEIQQRHKSHKKKTIGKFEAETSINEIKDTFESFDNKIDQTEERISDLEDKTF